MGDAYVERHRVARRLTKPRNSAVKRDRRGAHDRDEERRAQPTQKPAPARLDSKQRARSKLYNLTLDVNELRHEIQQLSLHRSLLYTRALYTSRDADGSAFRSAREYFNVFCRGYRVSDHTPPAFVQAIADEQLTLGVTGLGRDMLLEQWRLYTAYFAIRYYKMHSVRVMATDDESQCCILRGDGTFYGTFTMDALRMVFPAALRDPDVTQRLLGKEMVTPIVFFLYFNDEGRMVRHDGETDLLAAVTRALGDAELAATIVQRANVAEESMVEATPEMREQAKKAAMSSMETGSPPPPEPVEHIARVKRNRFTIIEDEDDEEKHHDNQKSEEEERPRSRGHDQTRYSGVKSNPVAATLVAQPNDVEPTESEESDPRLAIDYLLS